MENDLHGNLPHGNNRRPNKRSSGRRKKNLDRLRTYHGARLMDDLSLYLNTKLVSPEKLDQVTMQDVITSSQKFRLWRDFYLKSLLNDCCEDHEEDVEDEEILRRFGCSLLSEMQDIEVEEIGDISVEDRSLKEAEIIEEAGHYSQYQANNATMFDGLGETESDFNIQGNLAFMQADKIFDDIEDVERKNLQVMEDYQKKVSSKIEAMDHVDKISVDLKLTGNFLSEKSVDLKRNKFIIKDEPCTMPLTFSYKHRNKCQRRKVGPLNKGSGLEHSLFVPYVYNGQKLDEKFEFPVHSPYCKLPSEIGYAISNSCLWPELKDHAQNNICSCLDYLGVERMLRPANYWLGRLLWRRFSSRKQNKGETTELSFQRGLVTLERKRI